LLAALQATGDSPVLFHSSCRFAPHDPAKTIVGRAARHLDSWAMSRVAATAALSRAMGERDLAIVAGRFHDTEGASSLCTLCNWLDLPRLAIVDVRALARRGWAQPPKDIDALVLDRIDGAEQAAYWQTTLESLWRAPVLGWLDEAAALRQLCLKLPAGANPSRELGDALGARLLTTLRLEKLRGLARRAASLTPDTEQWLHQGGDRRFRIAVAYDAAYCGYYPETLDLLEAAGAELCDFSPLKSESLPERTDVVYFGCGHPERDPEPLARNHCLKQSLRCYAASGGRIYAEGSGLAYLCREIVFPCGRTVPMTGLLPATARWLPDAAEPEPTEVVFGASSWLVPARATLRGYRHTGWQIEPKGPMLTYSADSRQRLDVLGRGNVIGSRVLVNLAANRHLLRRFFEPYAPAVP
jgi:cobyrinic acid a,c-diamide synthase